MDVEIVPNITKKRARVLPGALFVIFKRNYSITKTNDSKGFAQL